MVFIVLALLALPEYRRWESYGGGPEQIRYSSLRQIHRGNVRDLEVAWTYDTGETGGSRPSPSFDGVLYALTPSHKAFALRDAVRESMARWEAS